MKTPDTHYLTSNYTLSKEIQNTDTIFEIGMTWYNYEYTNNKAKNNIFKIKYDSNRLNLNTKTSLGFKSYIDLYTNLIKQRPTLSH